MTKTEEYIISVLRRLMQNDSAPALSDDVSLKALFELSKMHSIEALVYRGLPPIDSQDALLRQWEDRVNLLFAQSVVQLQERDALIQALTGAGINVMPLKGCWHKERYPDIADRQMSDLDMLIHPQDEKAAEEIILAMGYEKKDVCFHHTEYTKLPYVCLELHVALLPDHDEHIPYYANIWEKAVAVENTPGLYKLKPEDEYLFYLVHLSKHLCEGGSGIRSIADNMIYRQCFPDMDAAYLNRELQKLGLLELAQQVQALTECWFRTGGSVPAKVLPLCQQVLSSGTYGSLEKRTQSRMERLRQQHSNPVIRFFVYSCPRFFRPMSEMKRLYPVLEKLPVLLPVFWIVRIWKKVFTNEKSFWQHLWLLFQEGR